ncbi:DUF4136 domain-containing protein [Sediminibacterium goheungense]|uniref:Uncharacterized protein DUF4136 n=1 Tax=Sediminibacterium goheungense TaxID=1086393 RepID=A0A4R6J339_9BACT|nr:DUF4136 domain-containing protein [Sediminibacterium goheungense]TDO29347.1 uncharacterized protein DUF4136 [Sediminibacterium goheungense]
MKKIQWMTITVLMVWVMISCGRTAYVQKDADVDFSTIKTYSWVTTQANKEKASVQIKNDDLTNRKIRQAIDKNLAEKGWKEVKKNPDVYLVYDIMIEEENKKVTTPVYSQSFTRWFFNPRNRRWVPVFYPSQFMGYDEDMEKVKEGTLTLTLMDADTDKTIWQGWTTSEMSGRKLTDKQIESKVKAIVAKLTK